MHIVNAPNVPRAYQEVMEKIHVAGVVEKSRNGEVITFQDPFMLRIHRPMERVMLNPFRDANPFFHVMEAIWMFAGRDDVEWLLPYNKRYTDYAEPDGHVHGAYGHRWRKEFNIDQIEAAIDILSEDHNTRQVVVGMWDPLFDLTAKPLKDRPCNTQLMFRVVNDKLNMTVINRSNDIVWGMLGANAVHMTMLHELIARGSEIPIGIYQVFSNNAHIYPDMPRYDDIMKDLWHYDIYSTGVPAIPLIQGDEQWDQFLLDAENFCSCDAYAETHWFRSVASPMRLAHTAYRAGNMADAVGVIVSMEDSDWRIACLEWLARRAK